MPILQNFSVPSGDDTVIGLDLTNINVTGATIYWKLYSQAYGIPFPSPVLLDKTSHSGGDITIFPSPLEGVMTIHSADTVNMLGNYYFELRVIDALGDLVTATQGIMTVTITEAVP